MRPAGRLHDAIQRDHGADNHLSHELLLLVLGLSEKSASEGQTRQKSGKRRSLRSVNEYFEPIFNAVWPSAASFRTEP
ncbi:hypothetical protein EQG41_21200, partial [Billgrantia azerbaijanica]